MLGRLLSLVLGLAVVAFGAYWALTHLTLGEPLDPKGPSRPKAILDQTREKTRQIEEDAERRIRETERKMDDGAR